MRGKSKTSVEILEERDALHARVLALETSLAKVGEETEHALRHEEGHVLTLCRIRTIVRAALPDPLDADEPALSGPPISKTCVRSGHADVSAGSRRAS